MAIQILDGLGRGFNAVVDSEGHLIVDALTLPDITHVSQAHGLTFQITSVGYDYSNGDTILLSKNTSQTLGFHVDTITMAVDIGTQVVVHRPTSEVVTPTGTAVVERNLNSGSANTAPMTSIADETTNSQGNVLFISNVLASSTVFYRPKGALILATNDSIAVDYVTTGGATANVSIFGFFE